uniref:Reverse transcriptase domain-containing protein n=1 Tax=Bombyx mori TaxID=7091 RepID=A0A8R2HRR7_BOMMO|nr:uncharacterized protein LOC110385892 [Bombyx mori]
MILNLEPKFGIEIKEKWKVIPTMIKNLEFGIGAVQLNDCNNEEKDIVKNNLRSKTINVISNYYNKNDRLNHKVLIKNLYITRKFLKERPDLIVARADKGNTTVIMLKTEYETEMRKMLNDKVTYKLLKKDPTNKWQKVANGLVNKLVVAKIVEEQQGKHLKAKYTVAPRIYGLRKTHKETCCLRPVVSCVNSPSYNLARFLHEILTPVIEKFQYNVKNSFDFVTFSEKVSLPKNYVLISLDVVSLFTNVRRDLILKVIEETWDNMKHLVKIPKSVLVDLITFCYDSSYFVYQGEFYAQMESSSMGNPASPVIANIVMNYVIDQILKILPFGIHFLKLYVDDTIAAIPESEVNNILELFNSFDNNIQFTMEVEKDDSLSFLDVLVKRSNDKLITDWFVKPISSGRLLNWNSNHPRSQKIGMIKGLLDRMTKLSSKDFYEVNFNKIRNILLNNNYEMPLVDSVINKFKENLNNKTRSLVNSNNNNIRYCRFPYMAELSNKLNRVFIGTHVRLAFYNILRVNSIYSKLKDPVNKQQQTGIVYKIPCSCDLCYIGQTRQYLSNRVKQHIYDCKNINILKANKTALATHHFDQHHNFEFDKIEILDKEMNWWKRNVSEMIFIKTNDTVNKRTDTNNLIILYNDILKEYKSNRKK